MNPIPASTATPMMSRQLRSGLSSARVNRVTSHVPSRTPTGLPITRPATTPSTTGFVSRPAPPSRTTPADSSAKNGTATPAETGASRCSSRSAGLTDSSGSGLTRISSPRTTPAMVAWIPLSCMNHHATTASGR